MKTDSRKGKRIDKVSFLSLITDVFVVIVLGGQLLVYHDFYYDILQTKYYCFCFCVIAMLILYSIWGLLFLRPAQIKKRFKNKSFRDYFDITDMMVLGFTGIATISTVLSPFRYEAFWGNEGRYTGLFLLLLYTAAYFCVTRCYSLKQWHIELFLIAGLLMCLFGITDFFDLDILHFKEMINEEQRFKFVSTIGNINTYTACVAMVMAIAAVMFCDSISVWKNIWYGICTMITFVALIMGVSDNAYLSLAALFIFLPFRLFGNWRGIRKYILLLAMFFSAVLGIGYVIETFSVYNMKLSGIYEHMFQILVSLHVVQWLWGIVFCFYGTGILVKLCEKHNVGKKRYFKRKYLPFFSKICWCFIIILAICGILYMIYDVNVIGSVEKYGNLRKYLLFNDEWGSNRGYPWRIAIENYRNYPLLQKIFGYGPDTYALVTYFNNMEEMASMYGVRYDSVHNELLQYLVTVGPLGLLMYLGIIFTFIWNVIKKCPNNSVVVSIMFAVICYHVQAVVNINQPIATPVMWVLVCIGMSAVYAISGGRK